MTSTMQNAEEVPACFPYSETFRELAAFQKSGTLCDVTIKVGEQKIRCHRNLLAAASPHFRAMFCGNMKESKQKEVAIEIGGVPPESQAETLQNVVDCIYRSVDFQITNENVSNLLSAADFLQVSGIF